MWTVMAVYPLGATCHLWSNMACTISVYFKGGHYNCCSFLSQEATSNCLEHSTFRDIYATLQKFGESYISYFCHNFVMNSRIHIYADLAFLPFSVTYCDITSECKLYKLCAVLKIGMLSYDKIH